MKDGNCIRLPAEFWRHGGQQPQAQCCGTFGKGECPLEKLAASLHHPAAAAIAVISKTMQYRDAYTVTHQRNVAALAAAIAREMGLDAVSVEMIRLGGLVHDIGKIGVPVEFLTKPTVLSRTEFAIMQEHAAIGADILREAPFLDPIIGIVRHHHERLDGSGYPDGLAGEDIPLEARVVAVADVVDAIASHRPYRPARGLSGAMEEILANRGRLYDPGAVEACLGLLVGGYVITAA